MRKFKLIVPSFIAIIFCMLLIAGSTFALFTSEASASISVTSGKVDVSASLDILHVYSAQVVTDEEYDALAPDYTDLQAGEATAFGVKSKYKYNEITVPVEENQYAFATGGLAKLTSSNTLLLNKMVPGDRVTLKLNLENSSTVDIKYRVIYTLGGGSDSELLDALVIKANNADLSNSIKSWTTLLATDGNPESIDVELDIYLPIDTPSKYLTTNYQDKTVYLGFSVQAVQANAKTEDFASQIGTLTGTTNLSSQSELGKATIYNNAFTQETDTTYSVELQVEEKENGSYTINTAYQDKKEFDVDVIVSKTTAGVTTVDSYDSEIYNNKPIIVVLNVGTGLVGVQLFHTHDNTVEEITNFDYDSAAGTITFEATSFSEYSVTYLKQVVDTVNNKTYIPQEDGSYKNTDTSDNTVYKFDSTSEAKVRTLNDDFGFHDSYIENGTWVHEVSDKDEFINIMNHIKVTAQSHENDIYSQGISLNVNLANQNTIYRIINDINFGGSLWTASTDSVYSTTFTGTLTGKTSSKYIQLSNIMNSVPVTTNSAKADPIVVGLFNRVLNATIENIQLSNMHIINPTAEYSGLFATGNNTASGDCFITFKNCCVEEDCSVEIYNGAAAYLPLGRCYTRVNFIDCINKANITTTNSNTAAFIGNGTTLGYKNDNEHYFYNCYNYGTMKSSSGVAGFVGYGGNSERSLTLINCGNYGDIYCTTLDGYCCGFFYGHGDTADYKKVTFKSVENSGYVYQTMTGNTPTTTESKRNNMYEYKHYDESDHEITIYDATTKLAITKSQFFDYVKKGIDNIKLEFDESSNLTATCSNTDIDKVVVTLGLHNLRLSRETGLEYPDNMAGESTYNDSFEFDSLAEINIKKVTKVGYCKPSGAADPYSPYTPFGYYIGEGQSGNKYSQTESYDTYVPYMITDAELLASLNDGYTVIDGTAYMVIKNADNTNIYYAISFWRNRVTYTVQGYDANNVLIATGTTEFGWDYERSGYGSYLLSANEQ